MKLTSMPQVNNNQYHKPTTINAKAGNEQDHDNNPNSCFFGCVRTCKIIVNTLVFEGLASCMPDQKRYQTIINNDNEIHPQIYENSTNNHDWKKFTKRYEKDRHGYTSWYQNRTTSAKMEVRDVVENSMKTKGNSRT